MDRRYSYALAAGVLSSGAPAGLLGIRLAKAAEDSVSLRQVRSVISADRAAYMYVAGATAAIFAVFGYVLGRQADQLAQLADTDALTGLLNARGFSARLRAELKRSNRYRERLSLLFLDLDGVKNINDRYGHRGGSEAIAQAGRVIRAELRETDAAARWGGDEFTILAPNTSRTAAVALGERIRRRIAEHADPFPLTASIGVATHVGEIDGTPVDPAAILRAADDAMYEAKKHGKNTVFAASSVETETEAERLLAPECSDI